MSEPNRKRGRPPRTEQLPPYLCPRCGEKLTLKDGALVQHDHGEQRDTVILRSLLQDRR